MVHPLCRNFLVLASAVFLVAASANADPETTSPTVAENVVDIVETTVETAVEKAPDVLDEFRSRIRSNWRKITKRCSDLLALDDEMARLPEKAWVRKDKRDQRERIREQLERLRSILFSTNSRKILAAVEDFDARIADIDVDIRSTKEKKFRNPGNDEKYDAKIAKLETKRHALEERRAEAARVVLSELNAIGLRLSGDAAEKCFFTVNISDLIDAAVVAKHVGLVVESLGELMKAQAGDVVSAKRYYGVYVAMLEVQKSCYDEYLDKSRNGPWRRRLAAIRKEATDQRTAALRSAEDESYDFAQRAVFRKNAGVFEMTQQAVDAYVKVLDWHEEVIARKAEDASRMLTVARSSLATVTLAGDFLSLVQTAEDTFDALLQLELPPLEIFDNTALQAEFSALTEKLR